VATKTTSKFWVFRTSSWPKWGREPKFQLSRSYGLGLGGRRGTNFAFSGNGNGPGAWHTEIFFSLKTCFLAIKSPKTWKSAIIFFHFSRHETNTSLIFHMWQVKIGILGLSRFGRFSGILQFEPLWTVFMSSWSWSFWWSWIKLFEHNLNSIAV
jgi:hypothetical protein